MIRRGFMIFIKNHLAKMLSCDTIVDRKVVIRMRAGCLGAATARAKCFMLAAYSTWLAPRHVEIELLVHAEI